MFDVIQYKNGRKIVRATKRTRKAADAIAFDISQSMFCGFVVVVER
jgi:hypothetical protein